MGKPLNKGGTPLGAGPVEGAAVAQSIAQRQPGQPQAQGARQARVGVQVGQQHIRVRRRQTVAGGKQRRHQGPGSDVPGESVRSHAPSLGAPAAVA